VTLELKRITIQPHQDFASSKVLTRISYNQIDILTENQTLVVSHPRIYGENQNSMKCHPYLSLIAKRPMALKYTKFYEQLPHQWQPYLDNCT